MSSKTKVNSRAILKHTFETMVLLRENKIGVDEAKAQANLIKQTNNILKYELDRAVAKQKYENLDLRNIEDSEI